MRTDDTNKTLKNYMIRRKSDGFFSTGGTYPTFSKKGKQWTSKGALSNHLGQLVSSAYRKSPARMLDNAQRYKDCEIVTLELVVTKLPDNQMPDPLEWIKSKVIERNKKQQEEELGRQDAWGRRQKDEF